MFIFSGGQGIKDNSYCKFFYSSLGRSEGHLSLCPLSPNVNCFVFRLQCFWLSLQPQILFSFFLPVYMDLYYCIPDGFMLLYLHVTGYSHLLKSLKKFVIISYTYNLLRSSSAS